MAFLLKSVTIDFDAIEYQLEERGTRIDWDGCPCESDIRKWIYGVVEEDAVEWFESDLYGSNQLFVMICEKLIDYCESNDVRIVSLDADGNDIEIQQD